MNEQINARIIPLC